MDKFGIERNPVSLSEVKARLPTDVGNQEGLGVSSGGVQTHPPFKLAPFEL